MLYKKILLLCDARQISVAELERSVGLGNATIRTWRTSSPSVERLKRVADFFGVTIDSLIQDKPTEPCSQDEAKINNNHLECEYLAATSH